MNNKKFVICGLFCSQYRSDSDGACSSWWEEICFVGKEHFNGKRPRIGVGNGTKSGTRVRLLTGKFSEMPRNDCEIRIYQRRAL